MNIFEKLNIYCEGKLLRGNFKLQRNLLGHSEERQVLAGSQLFAQGSCRGAAEGSPMIVSSCIVITEEAPLEMENRQPEFSPLFRVASEP